MSSQSDIEDSQNSTLDRREVPAEARHRRLHSNDLIRLHRPDRILRRISRVTTSRGAYTSEALIRL